MVGWEDNIFPNNIISYMIIIYNFQRNEISEQKQRLDSNLLKISQQLLVLQKSLQRKEKTFSRILRRKDKVW